MTYNPNKAVRIKDLITFAEYVKTGEGSGGGQGQSGVTVKYGYRIDKNNSDPATRVEYLFDAVGKTPAHMDFEKGEFDYGDWSNVWFVTDNKPLMLKSDGTVDYYLNPNDYTLKEDGTASDVANTSYDGNAMAQIPLIWIKRYEDQNYLYEIISDTQEDEDFHAYAHTRADGSIADYFYWGLFGASGNTTKIRSLSGQTRAGDMTMQNFIDGALANGSNWYIYTWSQKECIRTLLILMGKSTDTQAVFGNGNCYSPNYSPMNDVLTTGTLKDKGQFYGYNTHDKQVKVFHIEAFWGDLWSQIAGLITNNGTIYAKMTPEGSGYLFNSSTGYTNTGITVTSSISGCLKECLCTEYGMIPKTTGGSTSTYFPDICSVDRSNKFGYPIYGGAANISLYENGVFCLSLGYDASCALVNIGGGLSCTMPVA